MIMFQIFCPLYAEMCNVPLSSNVPISKNKQTHIDSKSSIARLCAENRMFALNYCQNPVLLQQSHYKIACMRYKHFCE